VRTGAVLGVKDHGAYALLEARSLRREASQGSLKNYVVLFLRMYKVMSFDVSLPLVQACDCTRTVAYAQRVRMHRAQSARTVRPRTHIEPVRQKTPGNLHWPGLSFSLLLSVFLTTAR
jgi:hypothetical protein